MKIKDKIEIKCKEVEILDIITEKLNSGYVINSLLRLLEGFKVIEGEIKYFYNYTITFEKEKESE